MAVSPFPVTINLFDNQAPYLLSQTDFSNLLNCEPDIEPILENEFGVSEMAIDQVLTSFITKKACKVYGEFAAAIKALGDPNQDRMEALEAQYQAASLQERWFAKGIYCDQLKATTGKECGNPKPFMYEGNKFFKLYKSMEANGDVKPFEGKKIELKEKSPYTTYLGALVNKVKQEDMSNIMKAMESGDVVVEKRGKFTNIRRKRDDEI